MTKDQWSELNVGDVVVNAKTNEAYTVADANNFTDGDEFEVKAVVLTRSRICVNHDEWILKRKTVDFV